ncbi:MAG: DNA helicase UvrD, partial [Deltaproteobacteria bacterium]|nr:DNA helicase UvrD [Deltaproteobacteria bacterium]
VVGTGDFTFPAHLKAIEEELEEREDGLFTLKSEATKDDAPRFMLTTEVSNIYKLGDKTRKVHSLIFAPSIKAAKKIKTELGRRGNILSDGRPIFGFTTKELLQIVLDADANAMLIPAHAWTPWFSIFGSKSGFDTIEECFGELSKNIYAIETGLSSDPQMNHRISMLDKITLISNSDAHSPSKLGREANVFETELSYLAITSAIKDGDKKNFLYTVEFFPEEGKYHHDGHRACGVLLKPNETRSHGGKCPVCARPVTVGVLNRIDELADRDCGVTVKNAIPSKALIPLEEIIAESMGRGVKTKGVATKYMEITDKATEFDVLMALPKDALVEIMDERIAEGIMMVRSGDVKISPGFDGEFGKIKLFEEVSLPKPKGRRQMGLLK